MLGLTAQFHGPSTITAWSSGTGFAGILGTSHPPTHPPTHPLILLYQSHPPSYPPTHLSSFKKATVGWSSSTSSAASPSHPPSSPPSSSPSRGALRFSTAWENLLQKPIGYVKSSSPIQFIHPPTHTPTPFTHPPTHPIQFTHPPTHPPTHPIQFTHPPTRPPTYLLQQTGGDCRH